MKTFLLAVVLILPGLAVAQLATEKQHVDLGELKTGPQSSHTFVLKHGGESGTLYLGEVTTTCGCTKPTLSAKELKPGEWANLTITVNTLLQPEGKRSWPIRVRFTNSETAKEQEAELLLSATLVREVSVNPAILALSVTGAAKQTITVTDIRAKPLTITKATLGNTSLTATLGERKTNQTPITVSVPEDLKPGTHADILTLTTDDSNCPTLEVPVKIQKRNAADVTATPTDLAVHFAKDKTVASELLQLRNSGKELQVAAVECKTPGVSVKVPKDSDIALTLRVTVDRTVAGASGQTVLTITFSDGTHPPLLVPVSWDGP
jgi:Protein of unknown function (DUF1573)